MPHGQKKKTLKTPHKDQKKRKKNGKKQKKVQGENKKKKKKKQNNELLITRKGTNYRSKQLLRSTGIKYQTLLQVKHSVKKKTKMQKFTPTSRSLAVLVCMFVAMMCYTKVSHAVRRSSAPLTAVIAARAVCCAAGFLWLVCRRACRRGAGESTEREKKEAGLLRCTGLYCDRFCCVGCCVWLST